MYCLSSVKNEIITLKCSNFVYVLGLIKIFQKICAAQIKDVQRKINFFYFPALRFIYFSPLITGINHNHLLNPKKLVLLALFHWLIRTGQYTLLGSFDRIPVPLSVGSGYTLGSFSHSPYYIYIITSTPKITIAILVSNNNT